MQFIDTCTNIVQIMLPQNCLLCGNHCGADALCDGCRDDLPYHTAACCPVCAMPSPNAEICGSCTRHPPHFDATTSVFSYAFPIDALLQGLKYGDRLTIAGLAAKFLARHTGENPLPDLLVPMPMHPARLRQRGFNQAAEIARAVARENGVPLTLDAVARIRETEPQASLPLARRKRNMRKAFTCTGNMSGKRVALLDDVMTSGASLDELAKTLKKAGASRVECWVVARTLRGNTP